MFYNFCDRALANASVKLRINIVCFITKVYYQADVPVYPLRINIVCFITYKI